MCSLMRIVVIVHQCVQQLTVSHTDSSGNKPYSVVCDLAKGKDDIAGISCLGLFASFLLLFSLYIITLQCKPTCD